MAAEPLKIGVPLDMEQLEILQLRLEQLAVDPISPVNGQSWYDTASKIAKIYQNDAIQPFFSAADAEKLAAFEIAIDASEAYITTIMEDINNIVDDGILSRNEKPKVKLEYDILIAEQSGIDDNADIYNVTTEKTAYDDSIEALTTYLNALDPAYDDFQTDTTITRVTFSSKFSDVYEAKQILLNKISSSVLTTLQTTSDDVEAALILVNESAANSLIAIDEINIISSDGYLTKGEKSSVILQYSIIITEQTGIDSEATRYGITTEKTNYDNAVTALTVYLESLTPAWDNTSEDTVVIRGDFDEVFEDVYSTKQILLNKIYKAAKDLADLAQADATQALADALNAQSDASAAIVAAANAQSAADAAQVDATASLVEITSISSDTILSRVEKTIIIRDYNEIIEEQSSLDTKADLYEIVTEKDDYDDAITALTAYLGGLTPDWQDTSVDTPIVPATFRSMFQDVYTARTALYMEIYETVRGAALTDSINSADSLHHARTKTVFDEGMISSGTFAVGDGDVVGNANAGIDGLVTGSPTTDIRFWAGQTLVNRAKAPFRVQNDGTLYASKAVLAGGWIVDTEAIYFGTKKISDGYATDGITLASDGSLHAKNFYINVNGDVGLKGIISFDTEAVGGYNVKIVGSDIYESVSNSDASAVSVNFYGYNGGQTKYRNFIVYDGKGTDILSVIGSLQKVIIDGTLVVEGAGYASIIFPSMNTAGRGALTPVAGMMIYNSQTGEFNVYDGAWKAVTLH